jgi:hypothetical protein
MVAFAPMIATSLLVAAVVAAAAPQAPPPQSTAVVAVADAPGPGPDLAMLSRAIHDALAERKRPAISPDEIRRRMRGQTTSASLVELDRAYLGAVAAQRAGDMEGAARTLRAVIEDLEKLPDGDESNAQRSRALLRLAYVENALAHKAQAKELIDQLLRADPSARPDPELYPPGFARQVDAARSELNAAPKRALTVTTGGRPARIFVEGRDRGPSPVTLSLPRGAYRVSAIAGSAAVRAGVVDLGDADRTIHLDVTLAEAFRPDGGPGLALSGGDRAAPILSAGATLGVGAVVAVSAVTDEDVRQLSVSVYDVSRGRVLREGRIRLDGWTAPPGSIAALASFLVSGAPSDLVIVKANATPKPDLKASPAVLQDPGDPRIAGTTTARPGGSRTMGWVAFSTGVLAVGTGALALYESSKSANKYSEASSMISNGSLAPGQDPGHYNSLISEGDSAANAARVSAAAAVAFAGTSVVLGYLSYRQTGEIGPFRF